METTLNKKRVWETPSLTVFGDIASLTLGDPNPTNKGLGLGDDVLDQVNPGLSSIT